MSDEVVGGPWSIDAPTRHAVVLELIQELLRAGNLEDAVAACEELLDENPDCTEALLIIADTAPRYAHGEVGVLAARQARARGVAAATLEAAALLAACEVETALALATETTLQTPADARAWAVRGQALELMGRMGEADDALAEAARLDRERFPELMRLDDSAWDRAVLTGLSQLSAQERDRLSPWTLEFCDVPPLELLRRAQPPVPPSASALCESLTGGRLYLFRRNLARGCRDENEVVARVVLALVDESLGL